jgi:hypothetical protein
MSKPDYLTHPGLPDPGHSHSNRSLIVNSWFALAVALVGTDAPDAAAGAESGPVVQWWTSSEDLQARMTPQPDLHFRPGPGSGKGAIRVDDSTTYQSVLGLGSSLEHSTCYNLSLLPPEKRERVLESLVHPERGIGMNLMRICIGTSDFAPGPFYTYNDLPAGEEDPQTRAVLDRAGPGIRTADPQGGATPEPAAPVLRLTLDPAALDEDQRPLRWRFAAPGVLPLFRRVPGAVRRGLPPRGHRDSTHSPFRTNRSSVRSSTRAASGRRNSSGISSATISGPCSRRARSRR